MKVFLLFLIPTYFPIMLLRLIYLQPKLSPPQWSHIPDVYSSKNDLFKLKAPTEQVRCSAKLSVLQLA